MFCSLCPGSEAWVCDVCGGCFCSDCRYGLCAGACLLVISRALTCRIFRAVENCLECHKQICRVCADKGDCHGCRKATTCSAALGAASSEASSAAGRLSRAMPDRYGRGKDVGERAAGGGGPAGGSASKQAFARVSTLPSRQAPSRGLNSALEYGLLMPPLGGTALVCMSYQYIFNMYTHTFIYLHLYTHTHTHTHTRYASRRNRSASERKHRRSLSERMCGQSRPHFRGDRRHLGVI